METQCSSPAKDDEEPLPSNSNKSLLGSTLPGKTVVRFDESTVSKPNKRRASIMAADLGKRNV